MKLIILRLSLFFPLLALAFLGNAQVRIIDHELTEPARKAAEPTIIKDTLRISEHQLIERKSEPTSYAKFVNKTPVEPLGWQPMVVGIPERNPLSESKEDKADSLNEVRSTPYHLLPLLKEKGHIQEASNSRWQPPVKEGGGDEK